MSKKWQWKKMDKHNTHSVFVGCCVALHGEGLCQIHDVIMTFSMTCVSSTWSPSVREFGYDKTYCKMLKPKK
jgi:hypothetical protein